MIKATRTLIPVNGDQTVQDFSTRVSAMTERLLHSIDGMGEVPLMDTFRILCQKDDVGRIEMTATVETRFVNLVEEHKTPVSLMMDAIRGDD